MRTPLVIAMGVIWSVVGGSLGLITPALAAVDYANLVDDRIITVRSAGDVAAKRDALVQFIWGNEGFPTGQPTVEPNVASPLPDLENLATVNRLRFSMESSETNLGYVFVPQAKNNRVVIVHQGHDCRMDDRNGDPAVRDGLYWTTRALVAEGYAVASLFQPHYDPEDCRTGDMHDSMWPGTVATGNPIKYFLEPTAEALNYLKAQGYEDFAMTGISGGGWTTMLYSAIDPRVRQSFPVAGSTPLYLRPPDYRAGDTEQVLPELYKIAGYLDLYLMAGAGAGRSSVQVYNRRDNCCFGQAQHLGTGPWSQPIREYEVRVRQALEAVGPGSFRVEIDEAANYHAISYHTAINVILAELEGNTRMVGAAEGTDAFVRGVNGNLWQRTAAQWVDTGLPMVGAPAVITGSQHPVDVFYRSPDSHLMHAYMSGGGWVSKAMGGSALLVDPVALSAGDGRWDVFTTSIDFRLYRWLWRPGWQSFSNQRLSETAKILGPPAAVSPALDQYQVFFRGWDQAVWEVYTDGASPWALRKVGSLNGRLIGYPAAVATGPSVQVFARSFPDASPALAATTALLPTTAPALESPTTVLAAGTPAPAVSIASPVDGAMLSGTVDITVNATADVAVTKVEVWLNGVPSLLDLTSPYQMPWKTTNMVDGTHTLQAKAYDVSGTVVASPLITVTINNSTSPGPGSTSSTSTSTSTTSTSTTSTSTTSTSTSSTSTSSTSTTSTSTTSAPSTSTSKPPLRPSDSTGVSITGPADGAIVSGTVDITATAGSLVGVSKVEIWIDGVSSLADRTAPYQVSWKTTKMVDGKHTLQAKAHVGDEILASPLITVTVNNRGTTATSSTSTSTSTSTTPTTVPTPTTSTSTSTTSTSTTTSTTVPRTTTSTSISTTVPPSTTTSTSTTSTTVSSDIPIVTITSPADGAVLWGAVGITAKATDDTGVVKVVILLNGVPSLMDFSSPYQMPWATTNMVDGKHTLQAAAYDAAGNVGISPLITVVVANNVPHPTTTTSTTAPRTGDTVPPAVSITAPADGAGVSGAVEVTAVASDDVGVTKVEFLVDGTVNATDVTAPYGFTWDAGAAGGGVHTITARAYDAANNATTSGAVSVTVTVVMQPSTVARLLQATQQGDNSWSWAPASLSPGATPVGTPTGTAPGRVAQMFTRMSDGHLASATFSDGAWRFSDHGGQISGSPTAAGPAAWARGGAGDLQFFDGTGWSSKGGRLE